MESPPNNTTCWYQHRRLRIILLICFGIVALIVCRLTLWKGKSDWEEYKAELEAKGETFDPKAFVPPSIPDDQNILKAPIMEWWMYKNPRGGHMRTLIQIPDIYEWMGDWQTGKPTRLVEWIIYFHQKETNAVPTIPPTIDPRIISSGAATNVEALIVIDEAPLPDAIRNLAKQAKINIRFDPNVLTRPAAIVSFRWENLTALQALGALMDNYNLFLDFDVVTKIATVKVKPGLPPSPPSLSLAPPPPIIDPEITRSGDTNVMPLIVIDQAPLPDAIRNLARQAGINFQFDPYVLTQSASLVTFRWENVTPMQTLGAVLDNHDLILVLDPTTKIARVTRKPGPPSAEVQQILKSLAEETPPDGAVDEEFPLIVIYDGTPLLDVVRNFARQANVNIEIDPRLLDSSYAQKTLGLRWAGISPWQALQRVLREHNLRLLSVEGTNIQRVVERAPTAKEMLAKFDDFEEELKELHEACRRPKTRFAFADDISLEREAPNYVAMRVICQALNVHASAELTLEQSEPALQDVLTLLQMSKVSASDPATLVGGMIGVAINGLALQPVWEGLASHRWNETQLRILQEKLAAVDLLRSVRRSLQCELIWMTRAYETMSRERLSTNVVYSWSPTPTAEERARRLYIRFAPQSWLDEKQIVFARNVESGLRAINLRTHTIVPTNATYASAPKSHFAWMQNFEPDWSFHFDKGIRTMAKNQNGIYCAVAACALERYRLAHGEFPEKLEALVPQFIDRLPHDIVTGQPLKYRREANRTFILYSVGWNEKDDGGVPSSNDWNSPDNGDWVWRYPQQ